MARPTKRLCITKRQCTRPGWKTMVIFFLCPPGLMQPTQPEWRCTERQLKWTPSSTRFWPGWQKTSGARSPHSYHRTECGATLTRRGHSPGNDRHNSNPNRLPHLPIRTNSPRPLPGGHTNSHLGTDSNLGNRRMPLVHTKTGAHDNHLGLSILPTRPLLKGKLHRNPHSHNMPPECRRRK
jgi:hypothetical protein